MNGGLAEVVTQMTDKIEELKKEMDFFLTSAVKHLLRIWLKKTLYYIVHLLVGIGVSPYL